MLLVLGAVEDHLRVSWLLEPFCEQLSTGTGPGITPVFYWESACFVLQAGLLYIVFLMLPFSSSTTLVGDKSPQLSKDERSSHAEVLQLLALRSLPPLA